MNFNQNTQIVSCETWIIAIVSSAAIGCTSLVPWIFNLTFFERHKHKLQPEPASRHDYMKYLLSFAIGAILGDIFFHLIPESYHSHLVELNDTPEDAHKKVGLSVIAGIFMFIIVEMVLENWSNCNEKTSPTTISSSSASTINEHHRNHKHQKITSRYDDKGETLGTKNRTKDLNLRTQSSIYDNTIQEEHMEHIIDNSNNNNHMITNFNIDHVVGHTKVLTKFDNNLVNNNNNNNTRKVTELKYRSKETNSSTNNNGSLDEQQILGTKSIIEEDCEKSTCASGGEINSKPIDTAGYLSLIANGFDNFTHGLAIGASFLVGPKVGLLTTFVIFIHEIPHEICDYAILVNSGFSRLEAVKANFSVSLFGILGTATALCVKSIETLNSKTIWILPFSAGGFLYIALVNLLPEILDHKTDRRNTIGQVACVVLGILFMAFVAVI